MGTDDEVRERQELQRRAYGPRGTALTAEEEARLRRLQSVAGGSGSEPGGSAARTVDAHESAPDDAPARRDTARDDSAREGAARDDSAREGAAREDSAHEGPAADDVAAGSEPPPSPPSSRPPSRTRSRWVGPGWPRPRVLGIAVIALLAVGTLIGVSIPRPPDISLPLTSEQEERRDKLLRNSEELDRGSIALLAVEGEALLWFGTRNDGALLCGMLDIEGQAVRSACSAKNEMRNSIVYMPDYSDGTTTGTSYDAQLLLSGSGVPAGVLQSYERGEDLWKYMGLTTAERQTAERLMADDRESHPSIVGYLGAMPIWLLSSREERCLLVETATDGDVRSCIPAAPRQELTIGAGSSTEAMTIEPEQRITLGMPGEDGRDAALLELRFKQGQMPYLTITIGEPPPFWGTRIE